MNSIEIEEEKELVCEMCKCVHSIEYDDYPHLHDDDSIPCDECAHLMREKRDLYRR